MEDFPNSKKREEVAEELRNMYPQSSEAHVVKFMNGMYDQGYIYSEQPEDGLKRVVISSAGERKIEQDIQDPAHQVDIFLKEAQRADNVYEWFGGIALWNKEYNINILRTIYKFNPMIRFAFYEFSLSDSVTETDLRLFDPENIPAPGDSWPSPDDVESNETSEAPPQIGDENSDYVSQEDLPEEMEKLLAAGIVKNMTTRSIFINNKNKFLADFGKR